MDLDKINRKLYLINKGNHIVLEYTIVSTNFLTRIVAGILNEEGEGFLINNNIFQLNKDEFHLKDPFYLKIKHADNNSSRPVLYVSDRSNHRI